MSDSRRNSWLELRDRERTAPRLAIMAPSLVSLQLTIQEQNALVSVNYRKHVAIGSAPALFVLGCGDERCVGGGHDITSTVLSGLRRGQTLWKGEHDCAGMTGTARCCRHVRFELSAAYQQSQPVH